MRITNPFSAELQKQHNGTARLVVLAGAVLVAISAFFPWAYGSAALDDVSLLGAPSPLQWLGLLLGVLVAGMAVGGLVAERTPRGPKGKTPLIKRFAWNRGVKVGALWTLIYFAVIPILIAIELKGLANVEWGAWIALVAAVVAFGASLLMIRGGEASLTRVTQIAWVEIVAIALLLGACLFGVAYALNQQDGGTFVALLVIAGGLAGIFLRSGVGAWFTQAGRSNRNVMVFAAFAVAFLFPFTQNGSDQNMSIATQVLVFASTAVGLNIVVGLAGLLDLGYIAFLGAGAFTAATLSESAFATIGWKPPFIVVMLISGMVSATLGLIIGSPTLRVSGDYLAIVTLAFGEIFRISMNNLDGADGPNLTNGSSGIPAIPNLNLFGFDFGVPHNVLGIELGRFSNYFFLMLIILAVIILVFTRLNYSRIGRGWVAIREDERAAEAMGVNVFGLKLLAFAGGAFLAGFAGAVKAHVDVSVTPAQYVFLESAFLLAAVVLGGMGTVVGVIVGATLLKLLPEKLRFISEYRLLIFGLLLVLMMRFRPEGLVPNARRQLEFHADDEDLADNIEEGLALENPTLAEERTS